MDQKEEHEKPEGLLYCRTAGGLPFVVLFYEASDQHFQKSKNANDNGFKAINEENFLCTPVQKPNTNNREKVGNYQRPVALRKLSFGDVFPGGGHIKR